jgi:hypothetical protein
MWLLSSWRTSKCRTPRCRQAFRITGRLDDCTIAASRCASSNRPCCWVRCADWSDRRTSRRCRRSDRWRTSSPLSMNSLLIPCLKTTWNTCASNLIALPRDPIRRSRKIRFQMIANRNAQTAAHRSRGTPTEFRNTKHRAKDRLVRKRTHRMLFASSRRNDVRVEINPYAC